MYQVLWVNRITQSPHWLLIIESQQPTPLIVILSYTATLGGLQNPAFINFIPKLPSLWLRLSWVLMVSGDDTAGILARLDIQSIRVSL